MLTTIESWGPLFKISFQLKLNKFGSTPNALYGADSLLHFTATDSNGVGAGDRVPAIWALSSGNLAFRAHIGSKTDWAFDMIWDLGEWQDINMIQHMKDGKVKFWEETQILTSYFIRLGVF